MIVLFIGTLHYITSSVLGVSEYSYVTYLYIYLEACKFNIHILKKVN